jgi:hypothetical protein
MIRRTCLTLTRVALILAALCWGMAQNNPQNTNQSQAPAQAKAQAPAQSSSANAPRGPEQMRGTTNDHRWAAAAKHADHRAAEVRKHHGKVK